jgi:hypothetical protein
MHDPRHDAQMLDLMAARRTRLASLGLPERACLIGEAMSLHIDPSETNRLLLLEEMRAFAAQEAAR